MLKLPQKWAQLVSGTQGYLGVWVYEY